MRLCGFNLGDFVMSVCKGCYSIVKDVTFVVKGAETFFSEFDSFYLLLLRSKSAEVSDSCLDFLQCAEVVFMVEMFQDVPTRNTFRGKFRFTVGEEDTMHFGTKPSKFLRCQTRAFVLHLV